MQFGGDVKGPQRRADPATTDTVIGKVTAVLDAFTPDDHGDRFIELQRRAGLPKSTLHRLTADMVAARLLDRVDGQFRFGGHLFELGMGAGQRGRGLCGGRPHRDPAG